MRPKGFSASEPRRHIADFLRIDVVPDVEIRIFDQIVQ